MNDLKGFGDFLLNLFMFLCMVYMLKSWMGIDWVSSCHAEEVLLLSCTSDPSKSTVIDAMYETYRL